MVEPEIGKDETHLLEEQYTRMQNHPTFSTRTHQCDDGADSDEG